MKKTLAVAALTGLVVLGAGTPALAAKPGPKTDPALNKVAYWEAAGYGTCSKVELTDGHKTFTLADGVYTLLVLKAGSGATANDVVVAPEAGVAYAHGTGKDLSHVISCVDEDDEDTETPGDGGGDPPVLTY